MDLELADYQRTVQSLETDISSRDAQLLTASQDANKLKETIDSLRNQLGVFSYHGAITMTMMVFHAEEGGQQRLAMEEKVSKMKGLLVKSKKELAESKKNVSAIESFDYIIMTSSIGGEARGNHTTAENTTGIQSTANGTD